MKSPKLCYGCSYSGVRFVRLNTIREICSRCPLAMTEDLLRDLTQYQRKHGKAVTSAARSLVLLFRRTNPKFLHKKDRVKLLLRQLNRLENKGALASLHRCLQNAYFMKVLRVLFWRPQGYCNEQACFNLHLPFRWDGVIKITLPCGKWLLGTKRMSFVATQK